jgi:hypothetical protein
MPAQIKRGTVILPRAGGSHPHVILSDPFGVERHVLVVNWTTLDEECIDDACVLQAGDHAAISHPSSMAYSRAHLWREEKILFAVANGSVTDLAPVSAPVFKRMIEGAQQSRELRPEWKAVLPKI